MLNLFCFPVFQLSLKGECESLDNVKDSLGLIFLSMKDSILQWDSQGQYFLLIHLDAVCLVPAPAQLLSIENMHSIACLICPQIFHKCWNKSHCKHYA